MKLKKTLALAALVVGSLVAGSLVTRAQDAATNTPPATAKPGGKNMRSLDITFLAKRLDLTDAQKPKVKTVLEDLAQKQRDLHADNTLSADDKKAKMKEIRDSTDAKLKDILTPDQYTQWEKSGAGRRRPIPLAAPDAAAATNAPTVAK